MTRRAISELVQACGLIPMICRATFELVQIRGLLPMTRRATSELPPAHLYDGRSAEETAEASSSMEACGLELYDITPNATRPAPPGEFLNSV